MGIKGEKQTFLEMERWLRRFRRRPQLYCCCYKCSYNRCGSESPPAGGSTKALKKTCVCVWGQRVRVSDGENHEDNLIFY